METDKVVARFKDGSLMKGRIHDSSLSKPNFHFETIEGEERKIDVEQLKAFFWVKDFNGDKNRKDCYNGKINGGRKVRIRFFDGELVIGNTLCYSSGQIGFFIIPADLESNNLGIFVVKSASERIEFL
jgi:hypothetical protein